jgi:hypothetical protein
MRRQLAWLRIRKRFQHGLQEGRAVHHGNICRGRMRLPLHIATGRPPTPIGSNLSQLDVRSWRLLKASSPYADGLKELDRQ